MRLRDSLGYLVDIRFDLEEMKIKFLQSLKNSYIDKNTKLMNNLSAQMRYAMSENYTKTHDRFINLSAKLEELNPLKILKRRLYIDEKRRAYPKYHQKFGSRRSAGNLFL